ncbi:MAG: serine/threonine-protein kinase, partial [Myxococcaceae bacterium]
MDQQIQLGKYRLYHHLASGGMGEVFLARHEGPAGFSKNVVVKRILSGIASDETFVTMFLNEARLAAMIEHPNVVQIFDLGLECDTYFIAMEYIHGRSLRQLRRRLRELQRPFPELLAARVCSQALQGLHYAHTLTDDEGNPLHIVHRDVSPDNVLIAFNGATKVVDFGIAKAAVNVSTTRAGSVKGKFAYMAPEQITGKGMDGRADVYATGVLLYELLSGQRPFNATSEPGLIRAILMEPATPVREANPNIPDALNDVIMRAIARKPDDRFASAEEMSFALEAYIQSTGKTITNAHVAALMRDLFPDDAAHKTPASVTTPPPRQVSYGLTPAPGSLPPHGVPQSAVSSLGTP